MKRERLALIPEAEPEQEQGNSWGATGEVTVLEVGPEYDPISIEHSLDILNSLVTYVAKELDAEAFLPGSYDRDLRFTNPRLRLMLDRRKVAVQKATFVVKTIMATLDKEYVLFYEGKFRQS